MGILDDPKVGGRFLLLVSDIVTVLLLTAGTAASFLSGYKLDVHPGAVLAFCILASAASAVLHRLSRPWWSAGAAAGLAGIFLLTREKSIPVLQWIVQKMGLLPAVYIGWSSKWEEDLPFVVLLLCAAAAWLMGWAAVRLRAWYLAALLAATPLLPAIQSGVLPAWGAMLAAFAGWGSMLLVSLFRRDDPEGLGRAQLLSLAGMGALILGLVMALPMEGYTRPQWATDARTDLLLGVRRRLERHFDREALDSGFLAGLGLDLSVSGQEPDATGNGGILAGGPPAVGLDQREDLLAAGPRRYSGRQVLAVQTDEPDPAGPVYLRGGSLGRYTGESWEAVEGIPGVFSGEDALQPSLYPALTAADGTAFTMLIRLSGGGSTGYYPYRLAGGGRTNEAGLLTLPEQDGLTERFLPGIGDGYPISYVPGGPMEGFVPLTGETAEEEAYYRDAVAYGQYLEVPAAAWDALQPLLEAVQGQDGLPAGIGDASVPPEFCEAVSAAARTAALLSRRMTYDLDVPAMKPGEDFAARFVEEGRGYCVHFATAGTLLLRMQGIPARYVSGYVVQLDSRGRGTALDSDAHAWVEIYLNGYGWHPVDMTPGYAGGGTGVELAGNFEPGSQEEPGEPEPVQDPEEALPQEETPEEEPSSPSPQAGEVPGREEAPEEEPTGGSLWAVLLKALAGTGAALCALGALYALALLLRRRERTLPDANRSVIRAYRRYERVLRWGGGRNERLEALGRKARFSQYILTEEEREAAWSGLEETAAAVRERQKKGRRWLLSLLRPIF